MSRRLLTIGGVQLKQHPGRELTRVNVAGRRPGIPPLLARDHQTAPTRQRRVPRYSRQKLAVAGAPAAPPRGPAATIQGGYCLPSFLYTLDLDLDTIAAFWGINIGKGSDLQLFVWETEEAHAGSLWRPPPLVTLQRTSKFSLNAAKLI